MSPIAYRTQQVDDVEVFYREAGPDNAPVLLAYFREHQPPVLAVWGRHDAFFLPAGALAYARDLPHAEIHLLDAGHFALETHLLAPRGPGTG